MQKFSDFQKINESKKRDVFTIRKNGTYFGDVTFENGMYITHGQIGENNEYETFEEVIKALQGFDLAIDDLIW